MLKKKAFLISLALLASNFLLPNQVRSGLEIDEEITSEKKEVNFEISRNRFRYYFHMTSRDFTSFDEHLLCRGETINLLNRDCQFGSQSFINEAYQELINTLAEEEEDIEELEEEAVEEVEEEVEEVETTEAEDIDFDSITLENLPYSVDCPRKNKDLKIKQNKNEKFVVRFASGKRFYRGLDFDEALEVFEETYEDKCVE